MPLRNYRPQAQATAQDQREALEAYADARFGQAVLVRTGVCTAYDAGAGLLTIQADGEGGQWLADDGATGVTAAQCVGQRVLCVVDQTTHRAYFRFVLGA